MFFVYHLQHSMYKNPQICIVITNLTMLYALNVILSLSFFKNVTASFFKRHARVYSLLSLAALDIPFNTYDPCAICSIKDPSVNVKMPHLFYCTVHHRLNHVLPVNTA